MTVNDINQKEFTFSKRGYDQDEVRQFMQQVAEQIHRLEAERTMLIKKLEVLAHKIEEHKKEQQDITGALLDAQKIARTKITEAEQQADKITSQINQKSDEILRQAKSESQRLVAESKELSQKLLAKAKSEADKSVSEAKASVEKTLHESRYTIEKEQATLLRIQKEVSIFKKELLDIYRSHIDLIQRLPESEEEKVDEKEVRELQNDLYKQQTVKESEEKKSTNLEKKDEEFELAEDSTEIDKELVNEDQLILNRFTELQFDGNSTK